ncbi:MFS transporter [Candidatus Woesearchaeota archaeon]|nr:MFS transporter [Candidatus Woesearchaeota archaeon]|tara:strand:- start:6788 stop:7948 length:1161 start_codon:yes stop_codon:yes gene_type:complete
MEKKVFTVLFIAVLASTIGVSIIEPLMAIYSESLGASGLYIGIIFSAFTLSRGLFTPIAGKLSDHHGRRNFISGGLLVYTLSSFAYIIAIDVNSLIVVRLVQGMASAFVAPLAMAYIGDIAPKKQEGRYMGTFTISFFLGFGIGPIIGGTLNHVFSMNAAFIAMGALGLISLALVFLTLPELGVHKEKKPSAFLKIIKYKAMQEILLIRVVTAFGVAGFMVFFPLYATSIGLNTAEIGTIITINLLVTALPQRYFGKLADKHNKLALIILGNLVMATTILLIPLTWDFYSLLGLNIAMGLGGAIGLPANTALAAQFGRLHGMGSVMGLLQAAFAVGMTLGPLIAGIILDLAGLTVVFFYTAAIVAFGTLAFYMFVKRNVKNHLSGS